MWPLRTESREDGGASNGVEFLILESLKRPATRRRKSQPVSKNLMSKEEDFRIAIVGAGISGVSAGRHLAESGLKPVVFEKSSFVGGRMSSERVDDFIIDKAAYTFPEFYKNLRGFVHELGLGTRLVQTPGTSSIFAAGEEHSLKVGSPSDFLRFKPLSLKSKKDVVKLFLYAQSLGSALNLGKPNRKSYELENESAADYLLKHYDPQVLEQIAYPIFCELFLGIPEKNSKLSLLATLRTLTRFKIFAFEEGMGTLPEKLSSHMEIRLETPVLKIDPKGEKGPYEIHVGGKAPSSYVFDAVVTAVPFPLIPGMINRLPGDLKEYCRHVPYSPSIVVALGTGQRLEERAMISNLVRREFKTIGTVVCDSHKSRLRVPEGKGLFTAILCEPASRALFHEPDERITREVLRDMDVFLPGFSGKILFSKIYRWEQGSLQLPSGQLLKREIVRHYLDNGVGNLYFAGETFPVSSLEASFSSGIRAARQLIRNASIKVG
jgi:protoporphyrinogen oxidase